MSSPTDTDLRADPEDDFFIFEVCFPPSFAGDINTWIGADDERGEPAAEADAADFTVTYKPLPDPEGTAPPRGLERPVESIWQWTKEPAVYRVHVPESATVNLSDAASNLLGDAIFCAGIDKRTHEELRRMVALSATTCPIEDVDEQLKTLRHAWETQNFPPGESYYRDGDGDVWLSILADVVKKQMSTAELTKLEDEFLSSCRHNIVFSLKFLPMNFCLAKVKDDVLSSLYDDMCTHAMLGGGLRAKSRIKRDVPRGPTEHLPHKRHPESFQQFCDTHHLQLEGDTDEGLSTLRNQRAIALILEQTAPGWSLPTEYTSGQSAAASTEG